MVRVSGVLDEVSPGSFSATQVFVRSRYVRAVDGKVITTGEVAHPVRDGAVDFDAVPGVLSMRIVSVGRELDRVELAVPAGDVSLADALEAASLVDVASEDALRRLSAESIEAIRGAQVAAGEARESADRAGELRAGIEGFVGAAESAASSAAGAAGRAEVAEGKAADHAESAGERASSAGDAASRAEDAAGRAKGSAGAAESAASRAETAETGAAGHAETASVKAGEAGAAADRAEVAETGAAGSAGTASEKADVAGDAASRAETAESNAARSAESAADSETKAGGHAAEVVRLEESARGHAVSATGSAESAKKDADRAATIAGSTRWVGTQLEVNGVRSPDLKGDTPVLTISDSGTWVIDGEDTGKPARGADGAMTFEALTPAQRESLRGEPGTTTWAGITDKPEKFPPESHAHQAGEVMALVRENGKPVIESVQNHLQNLRDGKADTGHRHAWGDITDKPEVFPAANTSTRADGGTIVQRWESGQISVPTTPDSAGSAASKAYVDRKVSEGTTTWDGITDKPSSFAPSSHTHRLSEISDAPDRHSSSSTGNSLMSRDSAGRSQVSTPYYSNDIANKSYVDSAVSGYASKSYVDGQVAGTVRQVWSAPSSYTTGVLYVIPE